MPAEEGEEREEGIGFLKSPSILPILHLLSRPVEWMNWGQVWGYGDG
jgi:hypothetical protein